MSCPFVLAADLCVEAVFTAGVAVARPTGAQLLLIAQLSIEERIDGLEDPPPPPTGLSDGFDAAKEGKKRATTQATGRGWQSSLADCGSLKRS